MEFESGQIIRVSILYLMKKNSGCNFDDAYDAKLFYYKHGMLHLVNRLVP
jgi:hypothetical protein